MNISKAFLILILSSLTVSVCAEDYLKYHLGVEKAERKIFVGQLEESVQEYDRLFIRFNNKVFAKDVFNQIQMIALCNYQEVELIKSSFTLASSLGIQKKVLYDTKCIVQFLRRNKNIAETVLSNYDSNLEKFIRKQKTNPAFSKIQFFISRDIKYRMLSYNDKNELILSKYFVGLDSNAMDFAELVKKNGYLPGELHIGIFDSDPTDYRLPFFSLFDVIFFHNHALFFLLEDELINGVKNGEIHPREFALIYEWAHRVQRHIDLELSENFSTISYAATQRKYQFCLDLFCKPESINDTEKFNEARKLFGVASVEHDVIKKRFERNNGIKLFHGWFNRF